MCRSPAHVSVSPSPPGPVRRSGPEGTEGPGEGGGRREVVPVSHGVSETPQFLGVIPVLQSSNVKNFIPKGKQLNGPFSFAVFWKRLVVCVPRALLKILLLHRPDRDWVSLRSRVPSPTGGQGRWSSVFLDDSSTGGPASVAVRRKGPLSAQVCFSEPRKRRVLSR